MPKRRGSEKNRRRTASRRAPRTAFQKGQSGNPAGRPAGVPNKVTLEARALCRSFVEDPAYQARFWKRWRSGKLPARLEEMVWGYAFGKPTQAIEVAPNESLYALLNRIEPTE